MAKRSIRAARLLAHHTQEVTRHTASGEAVTVMDLIERQLARRAEHAAAIALIDGELTRVYERLAADVPVGVQPSPSPMASLQAAELAPAKCETRRPNRQPTTAVTPAASVPPPHAVDTRGVENGVAAVMAAVQAGNQTPSGITAALMVNGFSEWQIRCAVEQCVRRRQLIATGRTQARRYELAPEHVSRPSAPPAGVPSSRRAVVDEGVEFEPVWTGAKSDPSLLGDRATRGHVLA